ncbi:MAG: tRNA (adenosine(37)-N6)-threonylcarbamoyltransferase complex dimerization subunit type 1 TsaB [Clostridiales Family XIII bacterium]|jgi:tRNA threonylcarbamoyladenosine biosynthesis protein TsaB|nr:tRNA (adenosine(37)-N6)-threonylcarbamoyltransferase complex dimerization subunit type 1 TsaB [Clostridiales Family XIII bacterium]
MTTKVDKLNRLLAVETTGQVASVALALKKDDAFDITERTARERLNHLTELIPMLRDLLASSGLSPADIDAIAVSAGPGSFTGIRIGVSAVRALAQTLNIPVVKVPTLETFAHKEHKGDGSFCVIEDSAPPVVCPVFDARRGQMYAGAFRRAAHGEIERLVLGGAYDPQAFFAALSTVLSQSTANREITFFGDGLDVFKDDISAWRPPGGAKVRLAPSSHRLQTASQVAKWALSHGVLSDYRRLEPIYMRQAEAQRKLEERRARGELD